jgi:hypothetical protein
MLRAKTTEAHYSYCDVSLYVMALSSHFTDLSVGPCPKMKRSVQLGVKTLKKKKKKVSNIAL